MRSRYVIGLDQSTQGTKAILADAHAALFGQGCVRPGIAAARQLL